MSSFSIQPNKLSFMSESKNTGHVFVFQSPSGLHRHPVCIFYSPPAQKRRRGRYVHTFLTCNLLHVESNVSGISGIRAYEQLGNRAFGPPGKMLAACVITVHNIGGIDASSAFAEHLRTR